MWDGHVQMTPNFIHALLDVLRIKLKLLINIMTKSSLIIHRKVTCCHFDIKRSQKKTKFVMMPNFGTENSDMTFIFEIDKVFINYS